MIQNIITDKIASKYREWSGEAPVAIEPLSAHGSDRKYFRIKGLRKTIMGAYNSDKAENRAFITLTTHFHSLELPVPELYHYDQAENIYLIEDLGDQTLFSFLKKQREENIFSETLVALYEQVVSILPRFQVKGASDIDFNICYPRHSFDKQSMLWDLNYFKYYFLRPAKIFFNEQKLEDDFHCFSDFLLQAQSEYFLYRDFQSRNIMMNDGKLYFIDYQGGRRGPLQYDVASLLFDAKADIPPDIRNHLLEVYLSALNQYIPIQPAAFMEHYYGFVLIRIMQALGAYGYRGFYQRKLQFLQSVPYAIQNLESIIFSNQIPVVIDELRTVWEQLIESGKLRKKISVPSQLTVTIISFSYKNGLPVDDSPHGGGFIFDCRSLPNPGRYPEYKYSTGKDTNVVNFLEKKVEVIQFLNYIYKLLDQVITNYQERNFTSLTVAFGCTGGQHRSVYCAGQLAEYLEKMHAVEIICRHRELGQE